MRRGVFFWPFAVVRAGPARRGELAPPARRVCVASVFVVVVCLPRQARRASSRKGENQCPRNQQRNHRSQNIVATQPVPLPGEEALRFPATGLPRPPRRAKRRTAPASQTSNATPANASSAIIPIVKPSKTSSSTGASRSASARTTTCPTARASIATPRPLAPSNAVVAIFAASPNASSNAPTPFIPLPKPFLAPCASTRTSPKTARAGSTLPSAPLSITFIPSLLALPRRKIPRLKNPLRRAKPLLLNRPRPFPLLSRTLRAKF